MMITQSRRLISTNYSTRSSRIISCISIQASRARGYSFVGSPQTLLYSSRISINDYQNKSINELKEELNKRGIVTRSKKRSILIDKLKEFDPSQRPGTGRNISITVSKQKSNLNNKEEESNVDTKLEETSTTSTTSSINKKEQVNTKTDDSTIVPTVLVSSPTSKVIARLMSEPDNIKTSTPKTSTWTNQNMKKTMTESFSSAEIGSPITTMKTLDYQAKTWPASINLPWTPIEEPLGTVIPFIPDNWTSHEQSHAPQLEDNKPNPADLQVSTASHPSTLPEGGPSMIAPQELSPTYTSTNPPPSSSSSSSSLEKLDADEILGNFIHSISNPSSSLFTTFAETSSNSNHHDDLQFENRNLNQNERNGLYKLVAFFGGSWILAGFFNH